MFARRLRSLPARHLAFELGFLALVSLSLVPLWSVEHPPLQDLPQHLAAIRVIHDHADPELAFQRYFEIALGRTQYLTYYLVVHWLAYPFGVPLANKLVLSAAIALLPYAQRSLLASIGRDQRLALFSLPLTYSAHLVLGFLNFILALPLAFFGLSLVVRQRLGPTRARAVSVALIAVVLFYTHVVPFALFALGAVLVGLGGGVRPSLRRLVPLLPAGVAAALWFFLSPGGRAVAGAAGLAPDGARAHFQAWGDALRELPSWLTDVLHGPEDEQLLGAWMIAWLSLLVAASAPAAERRRALEARPSELPRQLGARLAALAPLCLLGYFALPAAYDFIWPINARFALLTGLLLVLVVPSARGFATELVFAAVAVIAALGFFQVRAAFTHFERQELGALDEAIATIPAGSRVAGLIWDRHSGVVKFAPFLHAVAWYQVEKGGAVMFSFADFPQSPIVFKPEARPPHVPPRWEWLPQKVDPRRDLGWYDYVLTRGGPGSIGRSPSWEPIFQRPPWRVFRRRQR